jgi:hypothetical protein
MRHAVSALVFFLGSQVVFAQPCAPGRPILMVVHLDAVGRVIETRVLCESSWPVELTAPWSVAGTCLVGLRARIQRATQHPRGRARIQSKLSVFARRCFESRWHVTVGQLERGRVRLRKALL